jgi:hypothetical protein
MDCYTYGAPCLLLDRDCQHVLGVSNLEDSMEGNSKDLYSTGVDT